MLQSFLISTSPVRYSAYARLFRALYNYPPIPRGIGWNSRGIHAEWVTKKTTKTTLGFFVERGIVRV